MSSYLSQIPAEVLYHDISELVCPLMIASTKASTFFLIHLMFLPMKVLDQPSLILTATTITSILTPSQAEVPGHGLVDTCKPPPPWPQSSVRVQLKFLTMISLMWMPFYDGFLYSLCLLSDSFNVPSLVSPWLAFPNIDSLHHHLNHQSESSWNPWPWCYWWVYMSKPPLYADYLHYVIYAQTESSWVPDHDVLSESAHQLTPGGSPHHRLSSQ